METDIDWSYIHRLDDALVTQFLGSSAAALTTAGCIHEIETNDLRLSLQEVTEQGSHNHNSLLVKMASNNSHFIKVLCYRYGEIGLALNLSRFGLKRILDDFKVTLANRGHEIMLKSQLLLNRAVYVYIGGKCIRQVLLSAMIIDLADAFSKSIETIEDIQHTLSTMVPSDLAPPLPHDHQADLLLAKHLGFHSVDREPIPFKTERKTNRQLSDIIRTITDAAQTFMEQYEANELSSINENIRPTCEWLCAEAQRINSLSFPASTSLSSWELRRQNYFSAITIVKETLDQLGCQLADSLNLGSLTGQTSKALPDSARRFLITDMITSGTDIELAESATRALYEYCLSKNLSANDLLPEEFTHIHPALKKESLLQLQQEAPQEHSKMRASPEKKRVLERFSLLSSSFQSVIAKSSEILCLFVTIGFLGCGVKRAPRSEVEGLRPEIPFRVSECEDPAELEKDGQQTSPKGHDFKRVTPSSAQTGATIPAESYWKRTEKATDSEQSMQQLKNFDTND